MGWCHGFRLHYLCNDRGDILTFCLTGADVDDRDRRVWRVQSKDLFGKVFADRGYIFKGLFYEMFDKDIHIVHGLKANMKNKLMSMRDKILPGKGMSSSASTSCSRTRQPPYIQGTGHCMISSSISAPRSWHIRFSTISLKLCRLKSKKTTGNLCSFN